MDTTSHRPSGLYSIRLLISVCDYAHIEAIKCISYLSIYSPALRHPAAYMYHYGREGVQYEKDPISLVRWPN
jgi:hypothetical protein